MPYAFTQDVPITVEIHTEIKRRLAEKLGGAPQGLIVHLVQQLPQGLRYIDVWESQAALERFTDEHLHPIVAAVLQASGREMPAQEPPRIPIDVRDVWLGERQGALA